MHSLNTIKVNNWAGSPSQTPDANERGEIVAKLIGKAFETALPRDRSVMINHLVGSVGVLSLATIANGVFLTHRLDGAITHPRLTARNSAPIEARDVQDLAQRVQQIDLQLIDGLVEAFNAPPLSTTSPVGAMLADLPLRRTRRAHAD